jgi:hypothetical protein
MVGSTESQRRREKVTAYVKCSKQTTLINSQDPLRTQHAQNVTPNQKKQIETTEVSTSTRGDELELKVGFILLPSRNAFSRLTADLYFDGQKIDSLRIRILPGPLATDESEFSSVMDMTGIPMGRHVFRVEMYELWSSGEKLTSASKEAAFDYVPVKREDRLIHIPIIKHSAGVGLDTVSDSERNIYREIEEGMKRESDSRKDHW